MLICGVVLSGGQSSRMGTNKSLLPIGGKKAISHIVDKLTHCTDEVIIIANEKQPYQFLNKQIFSDRFMNRGPLAGLEAAMYHYDAELYYVAACDMPFVSCQIYEYLAEHITGYDIVIPVYENREHPLAGIYRHSVLPHIQAQVKRNRLRMNSFHDLVKVKYVKQFDNISEETLQKHFFNMNYPEQYEFAKRL